MNNKAVFLDRDGVLNHDYGYVHTIEKFKWIKGVKKAIKYLSEKNFIIIVITNQSGIGRGYYKLRDVKILHDWILKELKKVGGIINDFYICPHHPKFAKGIYKKKCLCRKPNNKLFLKAIKKWKIDIKKSFMVGDQKSDKQAAIKTKIKFFYKSKNSFDDQIKKIIKSLNL